MDVVSADQKTKKKYSESGKTVDESSRLLNKGLFDQAISVCEEYLKTYPNNALVLTQKGVGHSKKSEFDEALECFDLAIENDPNLAAGWYNKAVQRRSRMMWTSLYSA